MTKLKILGLLMLIWAISDFAWADDVTISTYYPVPGGTYLQLVSQTLGVGDNNNDGVLNHNDIPDPATSAGNVWIKGKVGIGTTNPQAELEVKDTLRLTPTNAPDAEVEGAIYYDSSGNVKYYHSGSWRNLGVGLGTTQLVVGDFIRSNPVSDSSYRGCQVPSPSDKYLENLGGGTYAGAQPPTFVGVQVGCPGGSVITGINVRTQDIAWGCRNSGCTGDCRGVADPGYIEIQYLDVICAQLSN